MIIICQTRLSSVDAVLSLSWLPYLGFSVNNFNTPQILFHVITFSASPWNSPVVNHQFLDCKQSLISHIGVFMTKQLHHQLLASQLFNDTATTIISNYKVHIQLQFKPTFPPKCQMTEIFLRSTGQKTNSLYGAGSSSG